MNCANPRFVLTSVHLIPLLTGLIVGCIHSGGGDGGDDLRAAVHLTLKSDFPVHHVIWNGTLIRANGNTGDTTFTEDKGYDGDKKVWHRVDNLKPGTWKFWAVVVSEGVYPGWDTGEDACQQEIDPNTNSATKASAVNFTQGKTGCRTGVDFP